ncbi:hypothetical protein CDL12_00013 [Handroanthus impetiginosus]|uniref:CCHC-type domain-containing protein n=1 Tax=Handroanthus impetiginosus TaxID=429701 RepID=A0A2G9IC78_9LAMI|nr:hypothetical protein CDL12_00013 [Handroanthus impetiginosus]
MYFHAKNVSRVFELYEKLFSLKQDGSDARSVTAYFASLKGAADEILLYHPLGVDVQTQKSQWDEFLVATFLSGLNPSLRPVRDSLLASDTVPTLSNALSRVLQVATADARQCSYCGRTNHVSEKCWVKFGKPAWANAFTNKSQPESEVVTLSRAEYEKLVNCDATSQATEVSSSAVVSPSAGAFVASHGFADKEDDWWRT